MSKSIATAVLLAVTALVGVAHAGDAKDDPPSRVVHFADLDLTKATGAATLYGRLHSAARSVCVPLNTGALGEMAAANRCVTIALARAVADVNAPTLTSFHYAKVGRQAMDVLAMEASRGAAQRPSHAGGK